MCSLYRIFYTSLSIRLYFYIKHQAESCWQKYIIKELKIGLRDGSLSIYNGII